MPTLSMSLIVWIAAFIIFLVVEAATAGLSSIWFAVGALAALICALLHGPLWLQLVWFIVVSVATLIATRPLAKKYVNSRTEATNADRSIGRIAVVTERIDDLAGTGAVRLDSLIWTARTLDNIPVEVGAHVRVQEIRGVRLIVEPCSDF